MQARRERQQRLACTCLTEQRNEIDVGIHQQIEREVLLTIARRDAPHCVFVMAKIAQCLQRRAFSLDRNDARIKRRVHLGVNQLIDQQFWHDGPGDFVERRATLLPALHAFAVLLPKVSGQLLHACVEQVGIFKHFVVEIVLGIHIQRARLDAHVDVF